jgi:hypothetical protein
VATAEGIFVTFEARGEVLVDSRGQGSFQRGEGKMVGVEGRSQM